MEISIVRPSASERPAEQVDVCIVVDVLRATTTATVLCQRCDICVVRTPADLAKLPVRPGGYALFSELSGVESEIPRFDNSPVQARDIALGDRTPVLVTTNGTRAVGLAMELAREVLLAGFVNLSAVVEYVLARKLATVAVMPAGNIGRGTSCIEDDGCANSIAARLDQRATEIPSIIAACRNEPRILERRANEPNLAADIELCFSLDAVPVVPRVIGTTDHSWFAVTASLPLAAP